MFRKLLALLAMFFILGVSLPVLADDAAAPAAAAASAETAAPAATPLPPVPNKGDTAWMMVATMLVILMTLPGLALFYGGLVRSKNMLSMSMQVTVGFSMIVVLWAIYGYSLAFTEGNAFFGGFDRLFLKGTWDNVAGTFANAATFSKGVYIPELVFVAFQATFAGDYRLPDHRGLRGTGEIFRGAGIHGAVVHVQLCARRAHGLVLDGSGRLCL